MKGIITSLVITFLIFPGYTQSSGPTGQSVQSGLVAWYYLEGNALDNSGNGNNLQSFGVTPTEDRFGNPSKALSFTNTQSQVTNYLKASNPAPFALGQYSIQVWVNNRYFYSPGNLTYSYEQVLCYGPQWWDRGYAYGICIFDDNSRLIGADHWTPTNSWQGVSGGQIVNNEWYHLVSTYDGATLKFYINGQLKGSFSTGITYDGQTQFVVGGRPDGPYPGGLYGGFNGSLDDLGIWNRPLSDAEVSYLYTSQQSGSLSVGNPPIADIDGNTYNTVTIGNQVWMKENLRTSRYQNGDVIPILTDNSQWVSTGAGAACYYDNNSSYNAVQGKLYNWFAAADQRKLCPTGWHVPSDAEWTDLTNYLGGVTVAGGSMKQTGTTLWASPNTSATNSSGFTAIPGGFRASSTGQGLPAGTFYGFSTGALYWAGDAVSFNGNLGWDRQVVYSGGGVTVSGDYKNMGMSIRCLKDAVAIANTAPTAIGLSVSSMQEGKPAGTTVGTLTATDTEGGFITYSLVSGVGSDDNASFSISQDLLKTSSVLDSRTKSTYSVRIRATDAGGLFFEKSMVIYVLPSNVPANGLKGWWPFNGNANDESGNGFNGVVHEAISTTDRFGNTSNGYAFDGSNDYIQVDGFSNANFENDFTISVWVLFNNFNNDYPSIVEGQSGFAYMHGTGPAYGGNSNKVGFYQGIYNDPARRRIPGVISNSLTAGIFHHVVLVKTELNAYLYVDGINVSSCPVYPSISVPVGNFLRFGSQLDLSRIYCLDGKMDDVAVWNRALTTQEISALYNNNVINPPATSLTDIDGNTYNTVTIGNQVWMKENLRTSRYQNGDVIPILTDNSQWVSTGAGAACYYDNNSSYNAVQGKLYNWFAAADQRKLCPTGWHVPSDAEWTDLTNYLGGVTVAGGSMKQTGTTLWASPNTSATNSSGFTAIPGGFRASSTGQSLPAGTFAAFSGAAFYWAGDAVSFNGSLGWDRQIGSSSGAVTVSGDYKNMGMSVRCLRDAAALSSQTISFSSLSPLSYGNPDVALSATASSGLPVSYTSSNTAIAEIVSGNMLRIKAAGSVTITATQAGNNEYTSASATQDLTIAKAVLTVTASDLTKAYGDTDPVPALSYSGFAPGDNASVLDVVPSASIQGTGSESSYYGVGDCTLNGFTTTGGSASVTSSGYIGCGISLGQDIDLRTQRSDFGFGTYELYARGGNSVANQYLVINNLFTADVRPLGTDDVGWALYGPTGKLAQGTPPVSYPNWYMMKLRYTPDSVKFWLGSTLVYQAAVNFGITPASAWGVNSYSQSFFDEFRFKPYQSPAPVNPGTYTISVACGSDDNYIMNCVNGVYTINKAVLTITADDKSRLYGDANPPLTFAYSGFKYNETEAVIDTAPVISSLATVTSDAGEHPISFSGGVDNNYSFNYVPGTLTIGKATLTVTADNSSRLYGESDPSLGVTYSGFKNSETSAVIDTPPTATTSATATSNVGTYAITASGGLDNNYTFSYVTGTLTINKASLTATADNESRLYGESNPSLGVTYSGFKNSETAVVIDTPPTASTVATATSNVGTYTITASGGSDNNYEFSYVDGTLTIGKVTLIATADNASRLYGESDPSLGVTYSGFKNSETSVDIDTPPTVSTAATATSNVGTYAITASGGLDNNYTFSYVTGTLTINKASLTATADNESRLYGESNPSLGVTYSGFKNSETAVVIDTPPTASTVATATSNVGTYTITASGGLDNNYSFNYVPGTLTIGKATLTATADNASRLYGESDPVLGVTYSGFKNSETSVVIDTPPAVSTVATATSNAGTYAITASGGLDNNYSFNYVPGTLTIGKATLTATADNASRLYGESNPSLGVTYSGFKNSETSVVIDTPPAVSTVATATSNVGTYAITAIGGSDNNYEFSYVSGTLTINKATLTVTADNASRLYGAANPALTVAYTGFKNGETSGVIDAAPTASTLATTASNVGTYPITVSGGLDNNYIFNFVSGTLTVNKAPLTATSNVSRVYGTANPSPLPLTYSGLVNGDLASVIDVAPTATTTATTSSAVGTYPITLTGGSDNNYAITTQNGTLTVTKATLTAVADNKTYTSGQTFPVLTGTLTGVVSEDGITATYTTTATSASPAGTYPITPVLTDSNSKLGNYNVTLTNGTLTITAASSLIVVDASLTSAPLKTGTTSRTIQAKVTNNGVLVSGRLVTFRIYNGSNTLLSTLTATTSKSGVASASLSIAKYAFGVYRVNASVSTGQDSDAYLAIYDASGAYVAGAGWIYSNAGFFTANSSVVGNASFGFVARYQTGSTTVVQGSSSFHLEANDFDFRSTSNDASSLVIAAPQVRFTGQGVVNGASGYSYLVSTIDGQFNRGTATDKYRIKIWNTTTGAVLYDNQPLSSNTATPSVAISGGNVILATGTTKREMSDELVVTDKVMYRVYPNPIGEEIRIRHDSDSEEALAIELMDLTGRMLRQATESPRMDGEYAMPVGDLGLSSGFYLIRISQGGEGKVVKVMKR